MAIDEKKPILQVAKEINMDPTLFREALLRLYKLKLIEEVKSEVVYVEKTFLTTLRYSLSALIGPLAEIVMEEIAKEMNFQLTKIPKSRVADFVYLIAKEIPGDKEKVEFKKRMLQEIHSMK
jgi:hypothetical protein